VDACSQALTWLQAKRCTIDAAFFKEVMEANMTLTHSGMCGGEDGASMDTLPSEYPDGCRAFDRKRWSN